MDKTWWRTLSWLQMHRVRLSHHVNTNRTWTQRQYSVILDMKPNCRWWDAFPLASPPNTEFKVLVITERVLHSQAPAHIRDLLQPHVTGRSWEKGLLVGQRSRLKTKGDHALPWSWLLNVGSPSNLMRTHRYFGDIPVIVSTISWECQEGMSSNLVQMSAVTQRWSD